VTLLIQLVTSSSADWLILVLQSNIDADNIPDMID